MPNLDSIKNNITSIHSNDIKQLSIIFDDAKKIIVEAPAGCGKTKTMISKIAYLIASNKLETTKKILALTFSVNASYKIKKDVFQQLPSIIECDSSESMFLAEKIVVSNYHGFCRKILSKYGYLISNRAIDYNNIIAISDEIKVLKKYISNESICKEINDFSLKVKVNDLNYLQENYKKYNELVKYCLLSNGVITYNAILTLTYELFTEKIKVKEFYQRYYPVIFIDEFQDTNCLSWLIIKKLINDETNLVLMGDPLQRIYGFIGAIPNLMNVAEETFYMRK
ncbi:MAG: UvrD-helicase domain-containing protein, partial [Clostridia bacterium]